MKLPQAPCLFVICSPGLLPPGIEDEPGRLDWIYSGLPQIAQKTTRAKVMPKQKIVIKVSLASDRSRARAMELVSRSQGVMSIGITGDGMEVIGEGMDAVRIVRRLRRKIGRAEILVVEPVSEVEEKYLDDVKLFVQQQPYHPTNFFNGGARYQYPPYPPPPLPRLVYPEHSSCTIM